MVAWNKGKNVGQMKPLTPDQVRTLKHVLEAEGKYRDLALLSTGIDTMLRASDLLNLTVSDVMNVNGEMKEYIQVQQKKTKLGVSADLSVFARKILKIWIDKDKKNMSNFLFSTSRGNGETKITVRQYQRLVKKWVKIIGLDPSHYSTHSMRRTKASLVFKVTGSVEIVRKLLGQNCVASTSCYLGIERDEALAIARKISI